MKKVIVNKDLCIACGACMSQAKDVFGYGSDGLSEVKKEFISDDDKNAILAMEGCPTGAISIEDTDEKSEENKEHECTCEDCSCEHCECEHE